MLKIFIVCILISIVVTGCISRVGGHSFHIEKLIINGKEIDPKTIEKSLINVTQTNDGQMNANQGKEFPIKVDATIPTGL